MEVRDLGASSTTRERVVLWGHYGLASPRIRSARIGAWNRAYGKSGSAQIDADG